MNRGIIDETEDWLPIGGPEPGFDENNPPRTEELVGKEGGNIIGAISNRHRSLGLSMS